MNRHPGGDEHTLNMLRRSGLRPPCRILDMGAGDGGAVRLLRSLGYDAAGLDITPGQNVERGDFLRATMPDESFDEILAQCSFFVSGDAPAAFASAYRLLRRGGVLMFSDVDFGGVDDAAQGAGFAVAYRGDMTGAWREYYIKSLWLGTAEYAPCLPEGKGGYTALIGRKE